MDYCKHGYFKIMYFFFQNHSKIIFALSEDGAGLCRDQCGTGAWTKEIRLYVSEVILCGVI